MRRARLLAAAALGALAALAGCSGYRLEGIVVEGGFGDFAVVPPDRLDAETGPRIAYADVYIHRDGDRPNRRLVQTARSNEAGEIVIELDEFGAGWMDERWLVQVHKPGYETVERIVTLPRADGKRLVITMVPGRSVRPSTGADLMEQYERFR